MSYLGMSEGTHIEKRHYGYWPTLEFMEHGSSSVHKRHIPFADYDKARAGKKDDWVILCTVNGADGPYEEERTVAYGPWRQNGKVPRRG